MIDALIGDLWGYLAGFVGVVAVFFVGRHQGAQKAASKAKEADYVRAIDIRRRVDAARGVRDDEITYRD